MVAGLLGCREVTAPDATPLEAGGDFTIGITAGTTPTFSWAGAGASGVSVFPADLSGFVPAHWQIGSNGEIRSPVRYGSQPTGSTVVVSPRVLEEGRPYRVQVSRRDGRSAYREFIP